MVLYCSLDNSIDFVVDAMRLRYLIGLLVKIKVGGFYEYALEKSLLIFWFDKYRGYG
jgi:hypothetical protein